MSGVYGQGFDVTIVAGADISAEQYKPINLGGTLAGSSENVFGVLQNKPQSGEHGTVRVQGVAKMYMSCSLGLGALFMGSNASSGYIALAASGYNAFGQVMIAANSGSFGTAYLYGGAIKRIAA